MVVENFRFERIKYMYCFSKYDTITFATINNKKIRKNSLKGFTASRVNFYSNKTTIN